MGQFYGTNIFLAESSATTGGLDSLLEPTGNIKAAAELAARAFGAQRAYFATNGTSTSNKIVVQALCAPGDIIIVDRNCHKSHHYGFVLSGAQPLYVEAFPLTKYSMYGAVPLRTDQEGPARPQGRGQARPRQAGRPDELHLRRPHVQHATGDGGMPRHQARPHLPVGRGLVRVRPVLSPAPAPLGDGCRASPQREVPRPRLPQAVRGASRRHGQNGAVRSQAPRHAPTARPGQGEDSGLPDELYPQVDVGVSTRLDDPYLGRGFLRKSRERSRRPSSPTPRHRPICSSSLRSTSRVARWSSKVTSSPCG